MGHGGATVYIAIFALFGLVTAPLVTVILAMNIAAASIAWVMFGRAGHLRWRLLLPFVIASVPAAYLGGLASLEGRALELVLGVVLLAAAGRLIAFERIPALGAPSSGAAFYAVALPLGAVLGWLAGATGIGGGIFLSPVILALGWASVRESASVASAFIVLNSLSGLGARLPATPLQLDIAVPLLLVVVAGAVIGSFFGAKRLPSRQLQLALGLVLLVASLRSLIGVG